ncbi:hypothetical protein P152DRAFT_437425 [Eremomyces bilateralis CBS 781.70]|uniref:T6SS Phospholipase effector Tle1-like catalytic domain-containing protein n=1 Tax=Eremomyces bilateralis CBS 781.70 TaxID=1392243 RepID=A0A6G1G1C0_9PEZI|nr:uncharacterized protein P152DRAFT_437425 [Eremomyces bilateralis CBS 781.70]KAF1811720.1 hypothetical protein P152DRAFT_437425 [Eremomyces bilateralis CBS 781.70]
MVHKPNSKKLVVCCDGTWQNSDSGWKKDGIFGAGRLQTPTNVTLLRDAIMPEDNQGVLQIVYYQNGIGSNDNVFDQVWGGLTSAGISENIREAYAFLVDNFVADNDDEIYLVGFSRGSYIARSIGGMIGSIGLLEKNAMRSFYPIFKDYENAGREGYKLMLPDYIKGFNVHENPANIESYLAEYKQKLLNMKLTRVVNVKAIGVFDTVGALGIPLQPWLSKLGLPVSIPTEEYAFYDTGIDPHVENAFQALAIDERRAAFRPTLWEKPDGSKTNLKQCWFPGAHSSVGGSYEDTACSTISLAWMMENLRPFLDFHPTYISDQVARNKAWYTQQQTIGKLHRNWGWGVGIIYESVHFPTSLGGSLDRTPRFYRRTGPLTGKPQREKLSNTNERMHASVRGRIKLGGLDENQSSAYASPPLGKWSMKSKNEGGKVSWYWEYSGTDKDGFEGGKPAVMVEDTLKGFELEVLAMDLEAQAELFS